MPNGTSSILIVDDHEDTLFALACALAPLGRPVLTAAGGDEALKRVLRGGISLLVLDVRMPGVSGIDVVRCLRGVEQTQRIPVLLLTGFGPSTELATTAYELGVADLVLKPVDPLTLRLKVRHLYETQARTRALEAEVRELRIPPAEPGAAPEPRAARPRRGPAEL